MSAPLLRFSGLLLVLVLGAGPAPAAAQVPPAGADASAAGDSLEAAIARFEASETPTSRDSLILRRRADSVHEAARRLRSSDPDAAIDRLEVAAAAWTALNDSSRLASAVGGMGVAYYRTDRRSRALTFFERTARLHRALGNEAMAARVWNNMGVVLGNQGEYRRAFNSLRRARAVFDSLGMREQVAWTTTHLGNVLEDQGRYQLAERRYRDAVSIHRDLDDAAGTAAALHNVGLALQRQGRWESALSHLREALSLNRQEADSTSIALNLSNISSVQRRLGRLDAARAHLEQALSISRSLVNRSQMAIQLNNLGLLAWADGRVDEAFRLWTEALALNRRINDRSGMAYNLENIGRVQLDRGEIDRARSNLQRAVDITETLRANATSPAARQSLLATSILRYRALTTAHIRAGQPGRALQAAERTRARVLADYLNPADSTRTVASVPSASDLQAGVPASGAAVLYTQTINGLAAVVVTRDSISVRDLPSLPSSPRPPADSSRRPTPAYLAASGPSLVSMISSRRGETAGVGPGRTAPTRPLTEVIEAYRRRLTAPAARDSIRSALSRQLYDMLVAPIEPFIRPASDLVIVPSGLLGYVPFETLQDARGTPLIQHSAVRYAPSLTVLRRLQQRTYGRRIRPLFAMGGAAYRTTPTGPGGRNGSLPQPADSVSAPREVPPVGLSSSSPSGPRPASASQSGSPSRPAGGRSPVGLYRKIGYAHWQDLPGSEREVLKLQQIAGDGATVLTGPRASESTLRQLSRTGQLDDHRVLHFATHGFVLPDRPDLSALVLSRAGASDRIGSADGYLTRSEIVDLDLRADVAVLSACQTGLGRYVDGEGIVGLSEAFLRAGANATLVSQWNVPDRSTRIFMAGVYRRARNRPFSEAVADTKRAFLRGDYGRRFTAPVHWAPFVYYGRR